VADPAVSRRASRKSAKRYQAWILIVRAAAQKDWPSGRRPTDRPVEVIISTYFTASPPDVDNIIKPVLDALNGLVYEDDVQVHRVTSQKLDLSVKGRGDDPNPLVAGALRQRDELLHILVIWED
jgi:crossover junction endodeoxyribonuclease RusA